MFKKVIGVLTLSIVGFSFRNENDFMAFENEDIQKIWKESYMSEEEGAGLYPHFHMVVDVVELANNSKKVLRILALYNSKEKTFVTDDKELEMIASFSDIYFDIDREGKQIVAVSEEIEDFDDYDYPRINRDADGFYSGKCKCGGTVMPMYDEQPFWIAFCNRCDRRWENSDSSPLPY